MAILFACPHYQCIKRTGKRSNLQSFKAPEATLRITPLYYPRVISHQTHMQAIAGRSKEKSLKLLFATYMRNILEMNGRNGLCHIVADQRFAGIAIAAQIQDNELKCNSSLLL